MRTRGWSALVLGLVVACGDDDRGDDSDTSGTTGSTESPLPCQSEDSRFTVFLADATVTTFELEIHGGGSSTFVRCPEATVDGFFAYYVECGTGQVTLRDQGVFPDTLVSIGLDGAPVEPVDVSCVNTSMCPKQGRNVCEVHLDR